MLVSLTFGASAGSADWSPARSSWAGVTPEQSWREFCLFSKGRHLKKTYLGEFTKIIIWGTYLCLISFFLYGCGTFLQFCFVTLLQWVLGVRWHLTMSRQVCFGT